MSPDGGTNQKGWDNFALSLKYQFYQNAEREAIVSAGVDWDIGHSGSARVGAEPFSTVTPALFFGKGFGDLPESARFLRPFALTGQLGISIPSRTSTSTVNDDGDAGHRAESEQPHLGLRARVQHSLPAIVREGHGLGRAVQSDDSDRRVQFLDGAQPWARAEPPARSIPGILWAGQSVQLGIEAVIPVNARELGARPA